MNERRGHPQDHGHDRDDTGRWRWGHGGREGWHRGQVSGGFGSQFDAWSAGAGAPPAGFGFGPEERPEPGEHRTGRGPRNYRRSDERIHEDVCDRLTEDAFVDASEISVRVENGEVTLAGTVPSRDQKWRAEECAERVAGVHDVINQLRATGR